MRRHHRSSSSSIFTSLPLSARDIGIGVGSRSSNKNIVGSRQQSESSTKFHSSLKHSASWLPSPPLTPLYDSFSHHRHLNLRHLSSSSSHGYSSHTSASSSSSSSSNDAILILDLLAVDHLIDSYIPLTLVQHRHYEMRGRFFLIYFIHIDHPKLQ